MVKKIVDFCTKGIGYKQLSRNGNVCVYETTDLEDPLVPIIYYEVVVLKTLPGKVMPSGKGYPNREVYPKHEDWGTMGWTYKTLV